MKKFIFEACIDNIEAAKYFIEKKVDRFESCSLLELGGLSPDIELFNYIKNNSDIKQVVMLRTNDNFCLNDKEFLIIKKQVKTFIANGAKSFIFGFLKNGELDIFNIQRIIKLVNNYEYCFHMAIDEIGDYEKNIPILINLGFSRILLKGGKSAAINNLEVLEKIVAIFGNKIEILIGGSVTKTNWKQIAYKTNASQFHGTKIA